ncbi:MAG TPA: hypothetical protein DD670_15780 [Planctomycetaceae bacterium]|nr:hypothetical protein [Planctomycetaceae bacterium]
MLPISRSFRHDRRFAPFRDAATAFVWLLLGVCLSGCSPINLAQRPGKPWLRQPRMASDSVVLDVFVVRFPFGDPEINGPAWRAIDEQHPPIEYRRRFLANGFRAGVLAGQLPSELSELLNVGGNNRLPGEMSRLSAEELVNGPTVLRGHFQLRPGAEKELVVNQDEDDLPVMLRDESGNASSQTYCRPEFQLAVRAQLVNDGRVRLELVPQILHGNYSQRWSADDQGMLHLNPGRDKRSFDDMKIEALLSTGQMLAISTMPSCPDSLGHHFFRESSGNQKLILIRLSQTQHDGEFDHKADLVIQ